MGRPKLPQTKEQIAIRLAPGTKARLSALIRSMQDRGIEVPLRSELLRKAIERGIEAMEDDLKGRSRSREAVATAAPAAPARARAVPPAPRMPVPSAPRPAQPARTETAPARAPAPSSPRPQDRPAPTLLSPKVAATAPAKMPAPSPAVSAPPSGRRGPIPGTLADRTLRALRDKNAGTSQVSLPALCRAVWPPNPSRVHQALRELRDMGLIELLAGAPGDLDDSDRELILSESGSQYGFARVR